MPLHVLAGPGCDRVGKLDYVKQARESGQRVDVVISAGRIYESLAGAGSVPSSNPPVLRMALALRTAAIRQAREKELDGFVLTSNGNRQDLSRLVGETGGELRVLKLTEQEACARVARLVPVGERRAACEEGIKSRWFGRYHRAPGDMEVEL